MSIPETKSAFTGKAYKQHLRWSKFKDKEAERYWTKGYYIEKSNAVV